MKKVKKLFGKGNLNIYYIHFKRKKQNSEHYFFSQFKDLLFAMPSFSDQAKSKDLSVQKQSQMQTLLIISLISGAAAEKGGGSSGDDYDPEWYESLWFYILTRVAGSVAFFLVFWLIIKCCVHPWMKKKRGREVAETTRRHEEMRERVESNMEFYRQMAGSRQNQRHQGKVVYSGHFS